MDDFLACSDLCEENQFFRQAQLLRALAGESGKVYIVAKRSVDYDDQFNYLAGGDGEPQMVFLDRDEAERVATERNIQFLREINLVEYGNSPDEFTAQHGIDLEGRVSEILGEEFALWDDKDDESRGLSFPESATNEQMLKISRLFDKLQLVRVIEAEFGV